MLNRSHGDAFPSRLPSVHRADLEWQLQGPEI